LKKLLKILGILVGVIVLAIACTVAWVNFTDLPKFPVKTPDVQLPTDSLSIAHGAKIARTECSGCHAGESGKWDGKLFLPKSEGMGDIWSGNITHHPTAGLGRYKDSEIAYLMRTGIKKDGSIAGPFMYFPNLSDEDVAAVIAFLHSDAPELVASDAVRTTQYSLLAKALIKFGVFKPLAYDGKPKATPPASDPVAYGRYLATARYDCAGCHAASFEAHNILEPEKTPGYLAGGNPISDHATVVNVSRNITPHPEQGIGKWTFEQFRQAFVSGIRPDGTALGIAMPRFAMLDSTEVSAIWAYLQTVPALETNPASKPH
jgi:mono/diheme cytochrome c family protein